MEFLEVQDSSIDLNRIWLGLKRRWLPALSILGLSCSLAAMVLAAQRSSYTAVGKLLIKPDQTPLLTGVRETNTDFEPLTLQGNPLKTEIEVINSNILLQRLIDQLDAQSGEVGDISVESIRSGLAIENVGGTDVIQITYSSTDAELAALVINELMQLYIDNNIKTNRAEASAAREFIAQQLPRTEETVRAADEALRRFKEENRILNLEQEASSAVSTFSSLNQQIIQARSDLSSTNAQIAALQDRLNMTGEQAIALSALSQSSAVQSALGELQTIQTELASQQAFYQDDSPQVIDLTERKAALEALVQQRVAQVLGDRAAISGDRLQIGQLEQALIDELVNLEVRRLGLANQIGYLASAQTSYGRRTSTLPQLEKTQRQLERQLSAAQATYEGLLKKLQEIQVAENEQISNARIIEIAQVPSSPSPDTKALALAAGVILLGLLLAGAAILLLEASDRSLKSTKEIQEAFGYDLLAAIPAFEGLKRDAGFQKLIRAIELPIPVQDAPNSPISELYRILRTDLETLGVGRELRIISVTSSVPKEGKSTVAASLAELMAEVGRRTLLVDGSLRQPIQQKIWHLDDLAIPGQGSDADKELAKYAQKTIPNLDVVLLSAVFATPAPLPAQTASALLRGALETYDLIFIDAPPLLFSSDALALSKIADATLMLARPGTIDTASIVAAKSALRRSANTVLGLVVNATIFDYEDRGYVQKFQAYHKKTSNPEIKESV